MVYKIVNTIDDSEIEFEVDGAEFSIEVIIPAPSGNEVAGFFFTDDQVVKIKEMIDKAIENMG